MMDPSGVQAAAYQVTQQFWNLAGATVSWAVPHSIVAKMIKDVVLSSLIPYIHGEVDIGKEWMPSLD
jgi:hypothetical protein